MTRVATQIHEIPRDLLLLMAALSVLPASFELILWKYRLPVAASALFIVITGIAWLVASYVIIIRLTGRNPDLAGLAKFAATSAVLAILPVTALACLILGLRAQDTVVIIAGFPTMTAAFFLVPLLAGWPVLQATSARLIDPLTALRRTEGARWSLITLSFVTVAMGRVLPSPAPGHSPGTAVGLAIGSGLIAFASALLAVAIAATAWRHMNSRDDLIRPV